MRGYKNHASVYSGTLYKTVCNTTCHNICSGCHRSVKIDERLHDLHAAQWESGVGRDTVHSSQCMSQSGEVFVSCV